jgi:hypothetical protein
MQNIRSIVTRGIISVVLYLSFAGTPAAQTVNQVSVDVCVYGGTSGGVVAAVQAARMGKTVAQVALNNHLGGMTSSGLGWTDIGHVGDDYIQGVAREFYIRIGQKYGTGFKTTFEPHVAEAVFNEMAQQAGVKVYSNQYLTSVTRFGPQLIAITMNTGNIFRAREFIDASYTGDLIAAAGVSYTVGRESTNRYGESLNGTRPPNTDFTDVSLDPYVLPGNPASGLVPLIQTNAPGTVGAADQRIQAYCFRLCLTTTATNKIPITAPTNYDATQYELLARYAQALVASGSSPSLSTFLTIESMPNSKTDINNAGAISIDYIGQSAPYVEADFPTRVQIWQNHKNYMQGFLYFLATDTRIPAGVRSSMQSYGYAKDEFVDNAGWPYELYVREARRMVSDYVMTQSNVFNQTAVADAIGMAGYFTDSHYCQRVVVSGGVRNEGSARGDITSPYPVPYRALIPRTNECVNLLVPWCVSSSHTAFSSLRMEPVCMILGQAAGTASAFAADDGVPVQSVNLGKLQAQLVSDQQAIGSADNSGITMDNADLSGVTITGTWTSSTASAGFYGSDYVHDGNTNKGLSSVTFTPNLPATGLYNVYARWTSNANRATNAPFDIVSPAGTTTILVDETKQGGQWVLLATTNFNAGTAGKLRIRNAGTSGFVIADAVQFVRTTGLPLVNIWATDATATRWGTEKGRFTISRSGSTNLPLSLTLNLTGTAVNGTDFQSIPTSMLLPAGTVSTNLIVMPFTNAQPVGTKILTVTISTNSTFTTGTLASATITIKDVPIYDWRWQYFGTNATNSAIAGDGANPTGDGVPNLVKYALGLDPGIPATKPLISAIISSNGYFQASYVRRDPPPPDIVYKLEGSEDLKTWSASNVVTKQISYQTNGTALIVCEPTATANAKPTQFLRLTISRF